MQTVAESIILVADRAGVIVSEPLGARLASFIGLLAKWNVALNLTGFTLDPPSDDALMRLVVEPLAGAGLVPTGVHTAIDVGSGGGSPALPLKLLRPDIQFVLVESKARKSAFLREAIRHLKLDGASVETGRFEELSNRPEFQGFADLVTVRAVRIDSAFWAAARSVLRSQGHVLLFGTASDVLALPPSSEQVSAVQVPGTPTMVRLVRVC